MKERVRRALDTAVSRGADYADVRHEETLSEDLQVKNASISEASLAESRGIGIRVLKNGAWGFASTDRADQESIDRAAAEAVEIAKASARVSNDPVTLAGEEAQQGRWATPYEIDPFSVSREEKLDRLYRMEASLHGDERVKLGSAQMHFDRMKIHFLSSEGADLEQDLLTSGGGIMAVASDGGSIQRRSFPDSAGGMHLGAGYEVIDEYDLEENAERTASEAVALLSAEDCPVGEKDIILDWSQLALQIHESCGHASELDRVLGMEANFAGKSFLTLEKLGNFTYGSEHVNIVANNMLERGLATRGWDDEGVASQKWHVVRGGQFESYFTSRELAKIEGRDRSRGCNRSEGWNRIPIIRIPNLGLAPGSWDLEDLIADTEDGIWMETNRSWSIDQMRLNFQFSTEMAWEIRKGKKTRMLRGATYQSRTPDFWAACDAVCNEKWWKPYGVMNCGKGEPGQIARMTHGSSPARFRNIRVGVSE
ncbi:MAG: TldD/PmbA family protein [Candidatus Krumholzibacteria bacterium]|jgi:TldD protein|nr:TldD/PmbA family protein [Candidatus Krumholzibacteria bacterium]MDP6668648.1 TldD/PmbA family protein [Candidatus Krumholzibacteria bacterium]MDP6796333.1 TldD/PmbA family protein [Candidatus Krumholzibacteria bacterium]MDP7021019.1 TldD/PmbA family protein [Candidatus Krumholzibacteria bacterium]